MPETGPFWLSGRCPHQLERRGGSQSDRGLLVADKAWPDRGWVTFRLPQPPDRFGRVVQFSYSYSFSFSFADSFVTGFCTLHTFSLLSLFQPSSSACCEKVSGGDPVRLAIRTRHTHLQAPHFSAHTSAPAVLAAVIFAAVVSFSGIYHSFFRHIVWDLGFP